jgi:hypothetical protein
MDDTEGPQAQTEAFLQAVFGGLADADPALHGYLWHLPGKIAHSFRNPARAAQLVGAMREGRDVYCGLALSRGLLPQDKRVSNASAAGLVALGADLDVGKARCPKTIERALAIVDALPLTPTVLVNSGHGLHAWWCFSEPWVFDGDADRAEAATLARAWGGLVKDTAAKLGFAGIDSAHDLARLLRVAGTFNQKDRAHPLPVALLRHDGPRADPSHLAELDELQRHLAAARAEALPTDAADAAPPGTADLPQHKLEALLTNVRRFRDSWFHDRPDLSDPSLSGYDLSICDLAADAGWTPPELAALVREHRRRFGDPDLKGERADYVERTIGKALARVKQDRDRADAAEVIGDPSADRDRRIAALATRFNIDLRGIEFVTGQAPRLRFHVGESVVELLADQLVTQQPFRGAMSRGARVLPTPVGQRERPTWTDYANIILRVAEVVDAGVEATVDGETLGIVRAFVEARTLEDLPPGEVIDRPSDPFLRTGKVWVRAQDLLPFAAMTCNLRLRQSELLQRLRAIGAERRTFNTRKRGDPTRNSSASFYGLPAEVVIPEGEATK